MEFRTLVGETLSGADRTSIFDLFDECYRDANHGYLEKTLESWAVFFANISAAILCA